MTDTQTAERGAEVAGRFGLASRGLVYCLLALLALQVATGDRSEEADRQGALRMAARQPFGAALLVAITIGFAGYALWRFAEAGFGRDDLPKRLLHASRGLLYAGFTVTSARLVLSHRSSGGSDHEAKTLSARLLAHGWGRPLAIAIGLGLVVAGGVLAWQGWRQTFEKHLRISDMNRWQRRWLPWLGTVGRAARGVILALIGLFLIRAAVEFDPSQAVGIDGALHQLARRPYGPLALAGLALGLLAYGLFSFVEARWRKVME
ncbi:MAG: rane protein [Actinomycetia bacterium]|nr:rane protein [Actinomycetes bacterium]